jgi:tetratricopeptide (TPR) repeat protein
MRLRADSYRQCRQHKKAIQMYNRILKLEKDPEVVRQCARLHCIVQQYEKAREVLQLAPTPNIHVTYMICETYLKEHNYEEIESELHRALLNDLGELNEKSLISYLQLPIEIVKMLVVCSCKLGRPEAGKYI